MHHSRGIDLILVLGIFAAAQAGAATSGVTYQGRIIKPDGAPLLGQFTQFKMQLRTPDSAGCLMYEEVQSLDLRNSNGVFSVTINDGSGARTDSTGLTLDRIFANRGTFNLDVSTCSTGTGSYTPGPGDGRNLVVLFKDETMSTWEPIPAQRINYVPFAFESKQIAGFTADSLLRVVDGSGSPLAGVSPLSNSQYAELLALVNGTSTQFTKAGELGGATLPTMNSGEVLGWNGTEWVSQPAVAGANSVTTTMIQNSAVDSTKIASGAVGTNQVAGDVTINTSGTLGAAVTTTRDFKIYAASPSTNYVEMKAPALTGSYMLTWPMNAGSSGDVLTTDGAGNLTWSTPAASSQWTTHGSNISYDGGGNVGIGTTAPEKNLHIQGADQNVNVLVENTSSTGSKFPGTSLVNFGSTGDSYPLVNFKNSNGSKASPSAINASTWLGAITFQGAADTTPAWVQAATIVGAAESALSATSAPGKLMFFTTANGSAMPTERMRINSSGNVGIGTTAPVASEGKALHVYNDANDGTVASNASLIVQSQNRNATINVVAAAANSSFINFRNTSTATMTDQAQLAYSHASKSLGFVLSSDSSFVDPSAVDLSTGNIWSSEYLTVGSQALPDTDLRSTTFALQKGRAGVDAMGMIGIRNATTDNASNSLMQLWVRNGSSSNFIAPLNISGSGSVGIGTTAPSAKLQLAAGSTAAGTAPLKFTSGPLLATAEDGVLEYNSSSGLWFTIGSIRYLIPTNTAAGNYSNVTNISNSGGSITLSPAASSGTVFIDSGTVSTGVSSGALTVSGGVGITGDVFMGATVNVGTDLKVAANGYIPQLYGSSAAGGNIKIDGTSNATKGNVLLASAGGNVGIGTTEPVSGRLLTLDGGSAPTGIHITTTNSTHDSNTISTQWAWSDATQARMYFVGAGSDSATPALADSYRFQLYDGTSWSSNPIVIRKNGDVEFGEAANGTTNKMVVKSTGRVGIGTTSPGAMLDVWGGAKFGSQVAGMPGTTQIAYPGSPLSSRYSYGTDGTGYKFSIAKNQGGTITDQFVVQDNGNVGIGTTSPGYKLDVAGVINATAVKINGVDVSTGGLPGGSNTQVQFNNGGAFGGSSNFVWDSTNGRLGVNTASPSVALEVKAGPSTTDVAQFVGSDWNDANVKIVGATATGRPALTLIEPGNVAYQMFVSNSAPYNLYFNPGSNMNSPSANSMVFTTGGSVGIGTTSPAYKLDVGGDVRIAASSKLYVGTTAMCDSTGCTASPSDARFKRNIVPLKDSLEQITKIQGVSYDWKDPEAFGDRHQIGFIAQDLEKIYPEVVKTDVKTGLKSVTYDKLAAPLVEAIKSIYSRILSIEGSQTEAVQSLSAQTELVQRLRDENEKQRKEIESLKAYLCAKDAKAGFCK